MNSKFEAFEELSQGDSVELKIRFLVGLFPPFGKKDGISLYAMSLLDVSPAILES